MYQRYFDFGGSIILVQSETEFAISPEYGRFSAGEAAPEHVIKVRLADSLPGQEAGLIQHWTKDGALITRRANSLCVHGPQCSELTVRRKYENSLTARVILESADLPRILARTGGIVLHASYIITQGRAVLFSAPSGGGKSTQAELWRVCEGADVINGDRALIRCTQEGVMAHGICFCGTSGVCENRSAPLAAIVLLGKAAENSVRRVSGRESFAALISQSSFYEWDTEAALYITETAARIASAVPVLRLDCLPDRTAVEKLKEALEL